MKISGFSFVRNGIKLYYPIVEAIKSILPICDEFVVAVGQGDEDDDTREQIASINDPKIKIIDTVWDPKYCKRGAVNSWQTDIAMKACTGDWLFYLQADEVVHEDDLSIIKARCEELLHDQEVEGLLFHYKHFWGDYQHYQAGHGWYPYEIRIVRNLAKIHSYQSAQSFRYFDVYEHPRQEINTRKLQVATVDARIFHYGWVRPPHLMQNKRRALDSVHWGRDKAEEYYEKAPQYFDYGPLNRLGQFRDTHPAVMAEMIKAMNWSDKLQLSGSPNPFRTPHKHELLRVRFLSWFERNLNGGRQLGTLKKLSLIEAMTISLIIPVYNRLDMLEKCLLAVSKQELPPDEIILSDDGSTEDIRGFFMRHKAQSRCPMKLVRQQHTVFRAARVRNNGVSVSTGDLLVFIDQDIIIPPLYIQTIVDNMLQGRFLSGYPVRLSAAQSQMLDVTAIEHCNYLHLLLPVQKVKIRRQFRKDYLYYILCRYAKIGAHGAKLRGGVAAINKADYVKVNGYDENFEGCGGEDDDLGRRLLASGRTGYNFAHTQFPLHLYHEPNYQIPLTKRQSNYSKQKWAVTRRKYICKNGYDAPRDDIEILDE